MIYFTNFVNSKSTKIHYNKLMGKIEEHERKKQQLRIICQIKYKTRIKMIIEIVKFGDTKILIKLPDKLPDDITLKKFLH